ncbi:MAG: FAD-dependent oxidoreductase, partial [Bacteroidota bacterium]
LLLLAALLLPATAAVQAAREKYDVIVYGADPEGIAAAVSAARNGQRTLLADPRPAPGGLFVYGMLNSLDLNRGLDGSPLTRGIFAEFLAGVGGRDSFDVATAAAVFRRMLDAEPGLTQVYGAGLGGVQTALGYLTAVKLGGEWYAARSYIDASPDADLAARAGAPYSIGRAELGETPLTMAATLVLKLAGVDWAAVTAALNGDGDPLTGATAYSAWGFGGIAAEYRPTGHDLQLRALNLGRQDDGSVLLNGLLLFGVDGLDPNSRRKAADRARAEAEPLCVFLRARVPGFAGASCAGTAEELYIRETRHIRGEYTLTVADIMNGTDFPDKVCLASYPIDLQAYGPDEPCTIIGRPDRYAIPFRCLVPRGSGNLLVVGRSASYTPVAAGSARVVPAGMAEGQAAGVAAAVAGRHRSSFRLMLQKPELIAEMQDILRAQGAYLSDFTAVNPNAAHPQYRYALSLMELGLVAGGYRNELGLDQPLPRRRFAALLQAAAKRSGFNERYWGRPLPLNGEAWDGDLDRRRAAEILLRILEFEPGAGKDAVSACVERGLLTPAIDDGILTKGQCYELICRFLEYVKGKG